MNLRLQATGWTGSRYRLLDGERQVGTLSFLWGLTKFSAELGGQPLVLRQRSLSSKVTLERGRQLLLEASRERFGSRTYLLSGPELGHGIDLRLKPDGFFRRSHRLLRVSRPVGSLRRSGALVSRWEGEFDDDLSLELCAFTLFLLALREQNTSSSVAAS